MHRDDRGMHLVITTFGLKAIKSRDRVSILGKAPVLATACSLVLQDRLLAVPLGHLLSRFREVEAEYPRSFTVGFHVLSSGVLTTCWSLCGPGL